MTFLCLNRVRGAVWALWILCAALVGPANADAAEPASTVATAPTPFGPPVDARRLAVQRGGAATAVAETQGSLRQATATNVESGPNAIRDGSFAGAAGLTTVIQNSGSNVLIQNSMTVSVQFK